MTSSGIPTKSASLTSTQNPINLNLQPNSKFHASTKNFLVELAKTLSTSGKSNSSQPQQSVAQSATFRSNVYSPASMGVSAPTAGTPAASGKKTHAKKRRQLKSTASVSSKSS